MKLLALLASSLLIASLAAVSLIGDSAPPTAMPPPDSGGVMIECGEYNEPQTDSIDISRRIPVRDPVHDVLDPGFVDEIEHMVEEIARLESMISQLKAENSALQRELALRMDSTDQVREFLDSSVAQSLSPVQRVAMAEHVVPRLVAQLANHEVVALAPVAEKFSVDLEDLPPQGNLGAEDPEELETARKASWAQQLVFKQWNQKVDSILGCESDNARALRFLTAYQHQYVWSTPTYIIDQTTMGSVDRPVGACPRIGQ